MNPWPFIVLLLVCTAIFGILLSGLDVQAIKENWPERRCELGVIFTGFLYKPSDDTRSANDFMAENFSFCSRQIAKSVIEKALAPLMLIMGKQMDAQDLLAKVQNSIRFLMAEAMRSFRALLDPFFQRFIQVGNHAGRIYQQFYTAMQRAASVALASLFAGIGMYISMENTVKFIVKVVIIILSIVAAIFILLFFVLFPFAPLLISVITILTTAGFGTGLGGMASTFCFPAGTKLKKKIGEEVSIESLKVGDILADGGEVEGILEVDGTRTDLYSVCGVWVSGTHMVYDEVRQMWLQASEHSEAKRLEEKAERLYCLRTTTREIHIGGLRFRDWEELPPVEGTAEAWEKLMHEMLNKTKMPTNWQIPKDYPMISGYSYVLGEHLEKRQPDEVQIGDHICAEPFGQEPTKVLGIYRGRMAEGSVFTDGVWWRSPTGLWIHKKPKLELSSEQIGYHFITESGRFWVGSEEYSGTIRDFTEVGYDSIQRTNRWMEELLAKNRLQ